MEEKPFYGTREAAEFLGVTQEYLVDLIREKTIPAYKVGREWAITRADLHAAKNRPISKGGRPKKKKKPQQE